MKSVLHRNFGYRRQRGAALLVALVLMVVITILAMSTMGTARLELLMAGNVQYSLKAFQAAQSAIAARVAASGFTTTMVNDTTNYAYPDNVTGSAAISYVTATGVPGGGYSLGAGFQAYHFEIDATGAAQRGAVSNQTQGFYLVGPGAN